MNRLKLMRKLRGLTQTQVADFMGVNQSTYCYWETGKVRVYSDTVQKLCQFYGVTADFLCGISFRIMLPVEKWPTDLQEVYKTASKEEKVYLEYKYGQPKFVYSLENDEDVAARTEIDIGRIIRELRGPLSLREFGEKCGISHTTIDTIEKGIDFRTGNPTQAKLATIQKIADACDVPVSYIIGEKLVAITAEMKAALFGPGVEVTDEMWEKVKEFAEFLKFKAQKGNVLPNT